MNVDRTSNLEVCSQPPASEQYASWKRWPKTYREPTHEEWNRQVLYLQRELERAQQNRLLPADETCEPMREEP